MFNKLLAKFTSLKTERWFRFTLEAHFIMKSYWEFEDEFRKLWCGADNSNYCGEMTIVYDIYL